MLFNDDVLEVNGKKTRVMYRTIVPNWAEPLEGKSVLFLEDGLKVEISLELWWMKSDLPFEIKNNTYRRIPYVEPNQLSKHDRRAF